MKRLIVPCLFIFLMTIPYAVLAAELQHCVSGRVVLMNGEQLDFPSLFLPEYTEPGLLASSTSSYHDSLVLFDANDIRYIDFWHPNHAEMVHRLYSIRLKRQPKKVAHYWAILDIKTPYGLVLMSYPRYRVDENGGLEKVVLYGNRAFSYPRIFALHYGCEYYDKWPLNTDSPILDYLNRDASTAAGVGPMDYETLFDTGYSPDDFFDIPDMEFGL